MKISEKGNSRIVDLSRKIHEYNSQLRGQPNVNYDSEQLRSFCNHLYLLVDEVVEVIDREEKKRKKVVIDKEDK